MERVKGSEYFPNALYPMCITLLQAMYEACNDFNTDRCQAWLCHAKRFFSGCMNNLYDIYVDFDENLCMAKRSRQLISFDYIVKDSFNDHTFDHTWDRNDGNVICQF